MKYMQIVTAPLNKEALNLGGVHYPGHTEILGHLTGQKRFFNDVNKSKTSCNSCINAYCIT